MELEAYPLAANGISKTKIGIYILHIHYGIGIPLAVAGCGCAAQLDKIFACISEMMRGIKA